MRVRRRRKSAREKALTFVIPESLAPQVRAAAAVLGFRESDIIEGGIVLYCTYVLKRIQGDNREEDPEKRKVPKWLPRELALALALSFVSRPKRRRGSSESQRLTGSRSEIGSVGSVLRNWVGEKLKGESGGGSPGP
jgi:hypothetical protein